MKYIYRGVALLSVIVCAGPSVMAQEDGGFDRSVDVVNEYQPTLRRAKKIASLPVIDDTVTFNDSFKYQLLNRVETVKTKPETLEAADMGFPEYDSPYRTLLQAGVGSLPALFGQITFNTGASDKYNLSINAGHSAQLGKVKLEDDTKVKAPRNESWTGLGFNRFNGNLRVGFDFKFKNSAFRFYGLNNIGENQQYLLEDGGSVRGAALVADEKQRLTSADVDFNIANAMVDPSQKFTFAASAGLGFWGSRYGVHETGVRIGGALRFPTKGASAIDVDFGVNVFKDSGGDADSAYVFLDRRGVDVKVFPHFLLGYDYMNLSLGLRLISVVGDDYTKDDFIVQPDLNADFFIGDGSVRLYAGLTGDYAANSYRHIAEMNNYVSPDFRKYIWSKSLGKFVSREEIRPAQSPILFKVGARAAFGKAVQLHVGFDFRSLGDEVFFVNRSFADAADTTALGYNSQFAFVQDDGKLVRLHGELNVNPTEDSNVRLEATYFKYSMDYIEEAWNRPNFTMSLSGGFKPVERLKVKASLCITGKRKAFNPSLRQSVSMKAFADLNAGADYYISNRWTAFLNLCNICCADQQMLLGYSSFRFNAMAGITYKF